ncbi:MAG TPA: InlB B-repeat-containing protein [Rectinemataceae bacterium]|nr:InlB B-repeat-containing protein [Rectinemataceae bacterium]
MKSRSVLFLFMALCLFTGCDLILGPTHTITYNANGATDGSPPRDSSGYRKGDEVTVMDEGTLVKDDYSFDGWCASASGTGAVYEPGDRFEIGSGDVILYAKWTLTPYAALGGGTSVSVAKYNGRYVYSLTTALPSSKPESNAAPTTKYYYTLSSTASASADMTPTAKSRTTEARREIALSAQERKDIKNRALENELLASHARQVDRTTADRARAAPATIAVGTAWNLVNVYDAGDNLHQINTTCRYVSDHAYFFIDNSDIAAMETYLQAYGEAFDDIYHVDREKFGEENDTDNNGKIIIVFSGVITDGVLGYFYSSDKFSKAQRGDSNEGDIFYLTTDAIAQGGVTGKVLGTLAHEFQHMIYFDEHYNRGVGGTYAWLNEALSQAASYYNGYLANQLSWINSFLLNYGVGLSLTHWTGQNYGFGAIFMRYLIDMFDDSVIKNMCSTDLVGISAVEAATGVGFNTLFYAFSRAIVMSGTGDSDNPIYRFTSLDLDEVQPTGRGGLLPYSVDLHPGDTENYWVYPYGLDFSRWVGDFGAIALSGTGIEGNVFGLSK